MSTRHSERFSASGARQSSLRVRNRMTGGVIRLVFEGSLRRLTGAQLRRHVEDICSVPAAQQRLTFNGRPVGDACTGAAIGLHDDAVLELRAAGDDDDGRKYSGGASTSSQDDGRRGPVRFSIEEENMDELHAALMPPFDIDMEESRLMEREYTWLMDQMRFETERMNRERELIRQRQELECEANMLERERCILGRRTLQERRKLFEVQQWIREEMTLEARLLNVDDDPKSGKF